MGTIRFTSDIGNATCGAHREEDGRLSRSQWIHEATGAVRDVQPISETHAGIRPTMREIYRASRMRKILDAPELDLTDYRNDEKIAVPCVLGPAEV